MGEGKNVEKIRNYGIASHTLTSVNFINTLNKAYNLLQFWEIWESCWDKGGFLWLTNASSLLTASCFIIAQNRLVDGVPASAVMKHLLYLIMLSEHKQTEHCGIVAFRKNKPQQYVKYLQHY